MTEVIIIYLTCTLLCNFLQPTRRDVLADRANSPYLALLRMGFVNHRNCFLHGRLLTCRFTFFRTQRIVSFSVTLSVQRLIPLPRDILPASLSLWSPDFPHIFAFSLYRNCRYDTGTEKGIRKESAIICNGII